MHSRPWAVALAAGSFDKQHGSARALRQPADADRSAWAHLQIEAVYHTSIVVAGSEFYFGGGINVARAGHTPFGRPIQVGGALACACMRQWTLVARRALVPRIFMRCLSTNMPTAPCISSRPPAPHH